MIIILILNDLQTNNLMKNSNRYHTGNFYKCPYQSHVYGTENSDLIYRKSYQGNLGDWDDQPDNNIQDQIDCDPMDCDEIENETMADQ